MKITRNWAMSIRPAWGEFRRQVCEGERILAAGEPQVDRQTVGEHVADARAGRLQDVHAEFAFDNHLATLNLC
jgi:hypothetical protein